jgi:hypothetical protein
MSKDAYFESSNKFCVVLCEGRRTVCSDGAGSAFLVRRSLLGEKPVNILHLGLFGTLDFGILDTMDGQDRGNVGMYIDRRQMDTYLPLGTVSSSPHFHFFVNAI